MKKFSKIIGCLLAITLSMSACTGGSPAPDQKSSKPADSEQTVSAAKSEEPVKISFLHMYNEEIASSFVDGAATMQAIEEFEKDYPNVEVEQIVAVDDMTQRVLTLSAAQNMPDLFMVFQGSSLETLVKNDAVLPLDEVYSKEHLDRFYPEELDVFRIQDKLYGMTLYTETTSVVVYNKKLWKEAGYDSFPTTWDEVLKAGEYFKSKGIDTFAMGDQNQTLFRDCTFISICNEHMGEDWFGKIAAKDPSAGFDNEDFITALKRVQSLGGYFNADWKSIVDTEACGQYLDGKAATMINGCWVLGQLENSAEEYPEIFENTGVAMFPGETGELTQIGGGVGCGLGLSKALEQEKGSARYEAAVKLGEYLTGDAYNLYTVEHGMKPAIQGLEFDMDALPQLSQEYLTMCGKTHYISLFDRHGIDGQVTSVLGSMLQDVASGDMTPEEGAKLMQTTYETLSD